MTKIKEKPLCSQCVETIKDKVNKAESWETNKKRILEKAFKTRIAPPQWSSNCEGIISSNEAEWSEEKRKEKAEREKRQGLYEITGNLACNGYDPDPVYWFCECKGFSIDNGYGDLKPHDCKNKEAFETNERDKVLKYLEDNNIKSISLNENNDFVIKYNNKNTEIKEAINARNIPIRNFLLKSPTKTLEKTQLLNMQAVTKENKQKANKQAVVLTIGLISLLAISALSIWWFVSRKKRNKL